MSTPAPAARNPLDIERLFVIAVAAHSLAIGIALLAVPVWGSRLGGFPHLEPTFYARQGGAFHVVVAIGYLMEHYRHRTMSLLLVAKCLAFAFLLTTSLVSPVPWVVPMSAAADGLMAAAALVIRRLSRQRAAPRR